MKLFNKTLLAATALATIARFSKPTPPPHGI